MIRPLIVCLALLIALGCTAKKTEIPEWVDTPPQGNDDVLYFVGISSWGNDKQECRNAAESECRKQFAQYLETKITGASETALSNTVLGGNEAFFKKVTTEWTNELVKESISGMKTLKWFTEVEQSDQPSAKSREYGLCEMNRATMRSIVENRSKTLQETIKAELGNLEDQEKVVKANNDFLDEVKAHLTGKKN